MMDQGLFNFNQFFVDQQSNNYIRGLTEVLDGDIAELPQRLQTFREYFKTVKTGRFLKSTEAYRYGLRTYNK